MAVISTLIGIAVGAVVGAAVGGLTAGLTGGNIGQGILFGALGGGFSGGIGGAFSGGLVGAGGGIITSGGMAGATAGGLSASAAAALAGGLGGAMGGFAGGRISASVMAAKREQIASANALKKLQEQTKEIGTTGVSKVTTQLEDNSRIVRKLSSLRIPLGITPKQNTEDITQNVYGVDTNTVATATQNMMGLNIATA